MYPKVVDLSLKHSDAVFLKLNCSTNPKKASSWEKILIEFVMIRMEFPTLKQETWEELTHLRIKKAIEKFKVILSYLW